MQMFLLTLVFGAKTFITILVCRPLLTKLPIIFVLSRFFPTFFFCSDIGLQYLFSISPTERLQKARTASRNSGTGNRRKRNSQKCLTI
jgi:hypothetical protein